MDNKTENHRLKASGLQTSTNKTQISSYSNTYQRSYSPLATITSKGLFPAPQANKWRIKHEDEIRLDLLLTEEIPEYR